MILIYENTIENTIEYKIQENEDHFRSLNLIDISIKKIHTLMNE